MNHVAVAAVALALTVLGAEAGSAQEKPTRAAAPQAAKEAAGLGHAPIRVNLECHRFRGGIAHGSGDAGQESNPVEEIVQQAGEADE